MSAAILRFDRFELRPAERLLLRDGEPVPLRSRSFDLLTALAERAGRLVTKAELLDLVWPGLVVEENNIAAQMVALRKAVGGEVVATVPGHGYRFAARLRLDPADAVALPSGPAPSRPAQRLFGRDDDLRRLNAALAAGGCVTLVGPGGVGKTVLARVVAAGRPAARVAWVDLAAIGDDGQVAGAVCRALGIGTAAAPAELPAALATALADRGDGSRLLVLDNAEHVVQAVAGLAAALCDAVPELALLTTSQVPLHVAGERVHAVDPLTLPAADLADEQTLANASVQLLVERIRAADARFPVDADALPLLREICARLDGLPLAIEMAASAVPVLGLRGVLAALEQRFAALRRGRRDTPARHRTLRAALEWSHGLLQPMQQRVFRRLGVFAGAFSLDLAVAVAGDADEERWDVVDAFAELVDRSLVTSLHSDPPRYRLLETVRGFALEQLDAAAGGEAAAARDRAVRALTVAMKAPPEGGGAPADDLANVPESLAWARAREPGAAVGLALAAASVATWTPWLGDAARWIEACEPLVDAGLPPAQQAAWWRELARFQTFVRGARSVEAARRAAAIERARGDDDGLFWSLIPLLRSRVAEPAEFESARDEAQALLDAHPEWPARHGVVFTGSLALEYRRRGDFATALRYQRAELEQAGRAGLAQAVRNAENNLAATLIGLGRHEEALARLDASLRAGAESEGQGEGDAVGAHDRVQRLNALIGLRRLDEADALAAEALRWSRRFDVLDVLQVLALLHALQGRAGAAAIALGHYRHSLTRRGAELPADSHAPWHEAERIAAAALGPEALAGLLQRGARLGPADTDRLLLEHGSGEGGGAVSR